MAIFVIFVIFLLNFDLHVQSFRTYANTMKIKMRIGLWDTATMEYSFPPVCL